MKKKSLQYIMKSRVALLFIIFILSFLYLLFRIVKINVFDSDSYRTQVLAQQIDNQTYSDLEIPSKRGTIYDSNNIALAESVKVYNVIFDPGLLVTLDQEARQASVDFLSGALPDVSKEELEDLIANKSYSHYEPVAKNLSYEMIASIDNAVKERAVKGISLEEFYKRVYPYDTLASDVLGFLSRDARGLYGLEKSYEETLKGQTGRAFGTITDGYLIKQESVAAIDGNDLHLNLDFTLQGFVEDAILNYKENKMEGDENVSAKRIEVVMMDPNNGDVLAMASYPNFNTNDPYNMAHILDDEAFSALTSEEKAEFRSKIWDNNIIRDNYEPGSTFKPMTFAMALEEEKVNLETASYDCKGSIIPYPGGRPISCWKRDGHGVQTMTEALENSCNVAFVEIGQAIGRDVFYKYQHMFGFGAITGIDLPGEYSFRNQLHTLENLNVLELSTSAFGQTFEVSPIQLITAFSSIVNGGTLYQPHMVSSITDINGNVVSVVEPEVVRRVISEETAEKTKAALASVVEQGTGASAQIEGYSIGGKTGTAEILPRGSHEFIVSFIGFAPVDTPEVVTLVIVDTPKGVNFDNSAHARALWVDIMEDALPYLGVKKDYVGEQDEATVD